MGNGLPVLIAAVLLWSASSGCGAARPAPALPAPAGSTSAPAHIPEVMLLTPAGEHTDVARVAAGRVALITIWATWCEACAREMDALNRLDAREAAGHDAVVIGVDVGEDPATVAEFAHRRGLRYAQLVDPDFAFADALGQRRVPATLVIDRQGRIVYRGDALDQRSLDALRQAIAVAP